MHDKEGNDDSNSKGDGSSGTQHVLNPDGNINPNAQITIILFNGKKKTIKSGHFQRGWPLVVQNVWNTLMVVLKNPPKSIQNMKTQSQKICL